MAEKGRGVQPYKYFSYESTKLFFNPICSKTSFEQLKMSAPVVGAEMAKIKIASGFNFLISTFDLTAISEISHLSSTTQDEKRETTCLMC